MTISIEPMKQVDVDAKGYVHWKAWQETYEGLVDADYLHNKISLSYCQKKAMK